MSSSNQIKFLGFSDSPTPSSSTKLGFMTPYYFLSNNTAGSIDNYNPSPTGVDVLKHFKLYVGGARTGEPLVNMDTIDLYNRFDQHVQDMGQYVSGVPDTNTPASALTGDGAQFPGLPLRLQKIHFYAKDGENGTTTERVCYALMSDPVDLGEGVSDESGEETKTSTSWNDRSWLEGGSKIPTFESYKNRIIMGGGGGYNGRAYTPAGILYEGLTDQTKPWLKRDLSTGEITEEIGPPSSAWGTSEDWRKKSDFAGAIYF